MIDMQNGFCQPDMEDFSDFVRNPLWDKLCSYVEETYQAASKPEFSKCSWEYGWNVKFKKAGKNLCTLYPKERYFKMLIVIGAKEKTAMEALLPDLSADIQNIYQETQEGNGQRWIMIELEDEDEKFEDVKKMLRVRRYGDKA